MIVVCTGCSAKFRVADEKVGPRGAKLRCSKCQTVFSVQHPVEVSLPAAGPAAADPFMASGSDPFSSPGADPFAETAAHPPRSGPPPLPRRATTLDARAAFEVDLEPQLGGPPAQPASSDPFAPPPGLPAPAVDLPTAPSAPPVDPFAAPAADFDPFAQQAAAAADPLEGIGTPAPTPLVFGSGAGASSSLALEELTTPPARRVTAPRGPAPMPMIGASEDPFGSAAPLESGLSDLGDDVLSTAEPDARGAHRPLPAPRAVEGTEEPIQLDPFGAAAVAADPLAVDEPPRGGGPQLPAEPTSERPVAVSAFRFRDVLVSAMALAALLLLALAILLVWRGGLAPADALRPSAILAVLAPPAAHGVLSVSGVSSGLYERARGKPLLFVRGTVTSAASTPLEGVRVVVEVVRDGAVLVRGEAPVGAVPGPEALYGAPDGAALSKAVADAATPEGARLGPGASAPFLVAFDDEPERLAGSSLRVHPVAAPAGERLGRVGDHAADVSAAQVKALTRSLAAFEEGAARSGAAARALAAMPAVVAVRVVAALARSGGAEARAAMAAVGQALVGPDAALLYEHLAEVYAVATEQELLEVSSLLVSPPAQRAWVPPRDKANARLANLTLGHKKTLARTHRDPDLLARLAAEGEPSVVRELLRNPLLTEPFAVRIAARRPMRPQTLRLLAESRRWRTRPAVMLALVRNPYAEPALSLKLLALLPAAELAELGRDGTVHPLLRATAARLARARAGPAE